MIVLDYVLRNPKTNLKEMTEDIGIPIQSSSAALSEVMNTGLIKEVGYVEIDSSTFSLLEFVHDSDEQDALAEARRVANFKQWVKKGLSDYDDLLSDDLLNGLKTIINQ